MFTLLEDVGSFLDFFFCIVFAFFSSLKFVLETPVNYVTIPIPFSIPSSPATFPQLKPYLLHTLSSNLYLSPLFCCLMTSAFFLFFLSHSLTSLWPLPRLFLFCIVFVLFLLLMCLRSTV